MAQFNVLNLANIDQAAERTKQSRIRTNALAMGQKELKRKEENRQKLQSIRSKVEGMPAQIEELEAQGLYNEADQLRNSYASQAINEIKLIKSKAPLLNADNYDQFRQDMIQAGAVTPDTLPTEYSADFFRSLEQRKQAELKKHTLTWADKGVTLSKDVLMAGDKTMWSGTPYEAAADRNARKPAAGDKPFKMSSGDTSAITRAVRNLNSSFQNAITGEFSGVGAEKEREISIVTEEASRIYQANGGNITHSEAANRAMRKLAETRGVRQPGLDPLSGKPADPLGLLQ